VRRLCEQFGPEIEWEGEALHGFPSARLLAGLTENDLVSIRSGYRGRYVIEAARAAVSEGYERWGALPTDELKQKLLAVTGVGEKVAECVLLFGYGRFEAFPVDVWIARTLSAHYGGRKPLNLGSLDGVAQQYLFYYARATRRIG